MTDLGAGKEARSSHAVHIEQDIERVAARGRSHTPLPKDLIEIRFSPTERAEQAWGLYKEYKKVSRTIKKQDPLRQDMSEEVTALMERMEVEIANLWDDPDVRKVVEVKLNESLEEQKPYQKVLNDSRRLRGELEELEADYFDLLRNQFHMREMAPTLRSIDMARLRVQKGHVASKLQALEDYGGALLATEQHGCLEKPDADVVALIANERIQGYHRQFRDSGIIMTPSRQRLLEEVIELTSQGTWMQLTGETGSGKTTFAKRASQILNDEPPQYASGEKFGDTAKLIGSKAMSASGESYYEFGPLVVGLTGFTDSRAMAEAVQNGVEGIGKMVLLDELNKFDQDALFGVLKIASTLRPGETFGFKELPGVELRMAKKGFTLISTMNPATLRYERRELDPAIDRLFYSGKRKVDYLPMGTNAPELYEAFLAILMDDNGRIRVDVGELGPKYEEKKDASKGITYQEISLDPKAHGVLYRFALASSNIHKSFDHKENVISTPTEPGFLEKTVLDMEVLVDWMRGYASEVDGGLTLTSYLRQKLSDFYQHIDNEEDRTIFSKTFSHFGIEIDRPDPVRLTVRYYVPLTPVEMGYLTPKTRRPLAKFGEEITPKTQIHISPDGKETPYIPKQLEIEGFEPLLPGTVYLMDGNHVRFIGVDPDTGDAVLDPVDVTKANT